MSNYSRSVAAVDEDVSDEVLLSMSRKRPFGFRALMGENPSEDYGDEIDESATKVQKNYEKKHTLESDEEEEDKYEHLNLEELDGQEEETIDFDEEMKITPFNMKDEMDEGHFDSEGNFIFSKVKAKIKDAWLDEIDWSRVKKHAGTHWQGKTSGKEEEAEGNNSNSEDEHEPLTTVKRLEIYRKILEFLQPRETVTKALKRYGGSKKSIQSRQRRWNRKAQGEDTEEHKKALQDAEKITKLTEMVDQLVGDGDMEVYGYTYEKFAFEIGQQQRLEGDIYDDSKVEVDMFADDVGVHKQPPQTQSTSEAKNELCSEVEAKSTNVMVEAAIQKQSQVTEAATTEAKRQSGGGTETEPADADAPVKNLIEKLS